MKRGDEVICVRADGPPPWWRRLSPWNVDPLFNCALTVDKKYVVDAIEEMPKDYPDQPGLKHRPEFVVVVDDQGYRVAYEQSRFRAI